MTTGLSGQYPQREPLHSGRDSLMSKTRTICQDPVGSPVFKTPGLDRWIAHVKAEAGLDGDYPAHDAQGPAESSWQIPPCRQKPASGVESAQSRIPRVVGGNVLTVHTESPSIQRETELTPSFKQKLKDAAKEIESMQLKHEKEKEILQLENHWIRGKQKFLEGLDPNFWGKFKSFSEMATHLRCEFERLVDCNDKLYAKCTQHLHGNEELQQLMQKNQDLIRENQQLKQRRDETARQNEHQANGATTTRGMVEEKLWKAMKHYQELDATKGVQIEHLIKQLDEKNLAVRRAAMFVQDVTRNAKLTEEELVARTETIKKLVDTQDGDRAKYINEIERYYEVLEMAYEIANSFAEQFNGSQKKQAQKLIKELKSSLAALQGPSDLN